MWDSSDSWNIYMRNSIHAADQIIDCSDCLINHADDPINRSTHNITNSAHDTRKDIFDALPSIPPVTSKRVFNKIHNPNKYVFHSSEY